jgi:hypothetical protein
MHHDKITLPRLPVYTATREYPAEYFCQRTYKKLALTPLHFIKLRNLDKLFNFIKLVPRNITWPIFYACPGALQMIFGEIVIARQPVICKRALFNNGFSL